MDGSLWVAWQDSRFSGGSVDSIAVSRSVDGGLSWSTPTRANSDNSDNTVPAFTPILQVRDDGLMGLVYFDLRPPAATPQQVLAAVWLSTSRDGQAWVETNAWPRVDLTFAPQAGGLFLGDYMGLSSQGPAVSAAAGVVIHRIGQPHGHLLAPRHAPHGGRRPRCAVCGPVGSRAVGHGRQLRRKTSEPHPARHGQPRAGMVETCGPAALTAGAWHTLQRTGKAGASTTLLESCAMAQAQALAGKHIVLGLSGGIACYKSAEFVRELTRAGATVQVVMTEAAAQFITPVTMQALSGREVYTSQWDNRPGNHMAHINLTRDAHAVVVAPASADFMAKLAQGRADELLSLLCLARPNHSCPLLVAPAMNREMWAHPATQRNLAQLRADGTTVLGPGAGDQACGEVGDGRMLEATELLEELVAFFQPKLLRGQRVLVTAGPTFEAIDPVRGITNHSSGKMGFAIARAAAEAGAQVTLVAGPVHLPTPRGVTRIDVQSAQQMLDAVLPLAAVHTIFVATAAVADWRPAQATDQKIKKDGSGQVPSLALIENPDILATVARLPEDQRPWCVGFAAESHDVVRHAREKRVRKGVPLIVGNIGPATFGRDDNSLVLVDAQGEKELPRGDKLDLARLLVAEIAMRLGSRSAGHPGPSTS